jgi:hypothetical protein
LAATINKADEKTRTSITATLLRMLIPIIPSWFSY